jgi:hypothetical protein
VHIPGLSFLPMPLISYQIWSVLPVFWRPGICYFCFHVFIMYKGV